MNLKNKANVLANRLTTIFEETIKFDSLNNTVTWVKSVEERQIFKTLGFYNESGSIEITVNDGGDEELIQNALEVLLVIGGCSEYDLDHIVKNLMLIQPWLSTSGITARYKNVI